ncbi:Nuclear receptor-interacting protein 2 [Cricetulus griseus]|uniref:Nuclear receptor-interacting protein 2 n=1 Tax=Cricetulus griseus TaxID=10029 RepID=G3GUI5_CRIGR|nr:Nuclear receptor-interacting protein 2 [Cricetulus griseus]ERE67071.1 nuclear receptor-interacting protein 2 [Cricetulus griseus]
MSTGQEARRDEGDSRRGQEASLRDRAHLSQQRRLKQATQFLHKDSADLLPLDSLKRLGTSKDLCQDQMLRVAVDTGTQHNQISTGCLRRLGLGKRVPKAPGGDLAPGPPSQVEELELELGQETVACSAQVVDVDSPEFCLGLQTLLSLKCCIDLDRGVLRLKAPFSELPFLPLYQEPGQ